MLNLSLFQGITSKIGNRHSLELPAKILSESKFGEYTCNATNKYGSDAKMIEVSGNKTWTIAAWKEYLYFQIQIISW